MILKESFYKFLIFDSISKHLLEDEKNYIIHYYEKFEEEFEKEYVFENNKDRIAAVIFYNIVQTNHELKSRKLKENKGLAFSIKSLVSTLNISEKTFYKLNTKFYEKFTYFKEIADNANKKELSPEDEINQKDLSSITKIIKKVKRKTETPQLSKSTLIKMLSLTCEYLKIFYSDKDAIKIKDYLGHLQVNLFIAGYKVGELKLEELFGEFYCDAGLVLTDGRNHDDFVKVKDIYGNIENKVYIDFRR